MKQKHVVTFLAIIAVTGAVSVQSSLAAAWRLDVSDRHVVDRSGLKRDPLIYTQLATGVPPDIQLKYDYIWEYQVPGYGGYGASQSDRSDTGEYKSGSPSNEGRYGLNPSDDYFQKESSGSSNLPYGGSIYGGLPTTPSADPMIKELSREPAMR